MPVMTASHLAAGGQAGAFEPQKQDNWVFEVILGDKASQELISLAMDGAFEPSESNEPVEHHYFNEKRKTAGKLSYEDAPIRIKDFVDVNVKDILMAWRAQVQNKLTGARGLARDYKKEARVKLYASDGSYERVWTIIGAWPTSSNWNTDGLDYTTAEACKMELTIAYDKAIWQEQLPSAIFDII